MKRHREAIKVIFTVIIVILNPCLTTKVYKSQEALALMFDSSLNSALKDAPLGCLQKTFCLTGQRTVKPNGEWLESIKLLDGLGTVAKILREVTREDLEVHTSRNLSLAYNVGLSDGGNNEGLCHDLFRCAIPRDDSNFGIGCAFCRFFLSKTCSRGCFATEVFCHSAWIGCTMDTNTQENKTFEKVSPLDDEMDCLKQTFCLAGAQVEANVETRTGRHLLRDLTKWNEIKKNVWVTAKVFKRILRISDKSGQGQRHQGMRQLVSSFDLGTSNKNDIELCEIKYPCYKEVLDLKIQPVF